ncbi:MAG: transcription antitermination factor NusB [Acidimicrobiales bacterium]
MIGSRREARERALALLYEADAKTTTPSEVLADLPVVPDSFAVELVRGVEAGEVDIDGFISRYAIDWTLDRMPVVDRTLLRMAVFELRSRPDVPTGVVISEAVELAKLYSTEESGRFVNGMLASIAAEVRGPALEAGIDVETEAGTAPAGGEPTTVAESRSES